MTAYNNVPRISVVMCTYRGTKYVVEQLHSIFAQSLQPAELIVCDDASGDETVDILYHLQNSAPFPVRIVVNDTTVGSTHNFDRAIQFATADFIALCDQDDVWLPDKLAVLTTYLVHHPEIGGVFSNAYLIDDAGALIRGKLGRPRTLWGLHKFTRRKQSAFVEGGAIDLLLKHDIVTGATLLMRAGMRRFISPIPDSWVHDAWIAWMLALHSSLAIVEQPTICYRLHAQQQLGVGIQSHWHAWRRLRDAERDRYARIAHQFEILRGYVGSAYPRRADLLTALSDKISLLHQRASLPHERFARTWQIGLHAPAYWKYARGWRSICKDLCLI